MEHLRIVLMLSSHDYLLAFACTPFNWGIERDQAYGKLGPVSVWYAKPEPEKEEEWNTIN